jgi:predicted lipoprotein with Yx(FWY)xxD motif
MSDRSVSAGAENRWAVEGVWTGRRFVRRREVEVRAELRAAFLVVVGIVLVCAGSGLAAPNSATVKAVSSGALRAKIVVDSRGLTLYHLMSEKKGSVACTGSCRAIWPPLLVVGKAKPVAGPGLSASKLGTIKRPDGGVQVTYNGLALYRYSADKKAGQVNGQAVEGVWYAVTPAGSVTKASPATAVSNTGSTTPAATTPAATTPSPMTPTTTTSSGGAYSY